jgi:hypothetical protein
MLDDTQRKSITSHAFALHDFLTQVGCSQETASRAVETVAREHLEEASRSDISNVPSPQGVR